MPSQPTMASAIAATSRITKAAISRVRTRWARGPTLGVASGGALMPVGHRRSEDVTQPALGADVARVLRVRLDLAARAQDQHVDAAVEHLGLQAARVLQQLVARPHPARLADEGLEQ